MKDIIEPTPASMWKTEHTPYMVDLSRMELEAFFTRKGTSMGKTECPPMKPRKQEEVDGDGQ